MSAVLELTAETGQALADTSHDISAWLDKGRALAQADTARQWDIGEWLLAGEIRLGRPAYPEALAIFRGYRKSTLKLLSHVARNVPAFVRTNALSWEHHKLVARFTNPDYQAGLLAEAVKHNLRSSKFRTFINDHHPPKGKPRPKAILVPLSEDEQCWLAIMARPSGLGGCDCTVPEMIKRILRDWRENCEAGVEGERARRLAVTPTDKTPFVVGEVTNLESVLAALPMPLDGY